VKITATLKNAGGQLEVSLATNDRPHALVLPPKPDSRGSSANGGELLFLALAVCYCNDIYREAAGRGIEVTGVEVDVEGEFGAPGEPAHALAYRARVTGKASAAELRALAEHTDRVAEVHNTLRQATAVRLAGVEVQSA
jgi:uncharacterized OsmC-like protein